MPKQPNILLVDDEESVRRTLGLLLERHGFKVVLAGTVAEALGLIAQQTFDVLIADLNISSHGDGFTVVSAMRHTQPKAVTLILTGFPDFESALKAIQEQVDDYFVKPAEIEKLVEKINSKLAKRTPRPQAETERLPVLVHKHQREIIEQWLRATSKDVEISAIRISDSDRVDHLPHMLDSVTEIAQGKMLGAEDVETATLHGRARREQGYTIPLLIREQRFFQESLAEDIQKSLLNITLDYLITDFSAMLWSINVLFEHSARAFLQTENRQRTSAKKKKK